MKNAQQGRGEITNGDTQTTILSSITVAQIHFIYNINRVAEQSAREEVNSLKESIEVAKVKAETDVTSASMMIARYLHHEFIFLL